MSLGPIVTPANLSGTHRTGRLPHTLTIKEINERLGFTPNGPVDDDKVTRCWSFTVNGCPCGIWDYKGIRWSTYDPHGLLRLVFPEAVCEKFEERL